MSCQVLMGTKVYCYLCLRGGGWGQSSIFECGGDDKVPQVISVQGREEEGQKLSSLDKVCRYLKLDLRAILAQTKDPISNCMPMLEETGFTGTLCDECAQLLKRFSAHYLELEVIRMKLGYDLKAIHDRMVEEGEENGETELKREMAKRPETLAQYGIVEELRKKTVERCSQKLTKSTPRVLVQRLSASQIASICSSLKIIIPTPQAAVQIQSSPTTSCGGDGKMDCRMNSAKEAQDEECLNLECFESLTESDDITEDEGANEEASNELENSSEADAVQLQCDICKKTCAEVSSFDAHCRLIHHECVPKLVEIASKDSQKDSSSSSHTTLQSVNDKDSEGGRVLVDRTYRSDSEKVRLDSNPIPSPDESVVIDDETSVDVDTGRLADQDQLLAELQEQRFVLKWNHHPSSLFQQFKDLFQTGSLTDIILICADGVHVKSHKMVLATCSSYFHNLFFRDKYEHPCVLLDEIAFPEIKLILEYMYRGKVILPQSQLLGLLKAAEILGLKGLVEDRDSIPVSTSSSSGQSSNAIRDTPSTAPVPKLLYVGPSQYNKCPLSASAKRCNTQSDPVPRKMMKGGDNNGNDSIVETALLHISYLQKLNAMQPSPGQTRPMHPNPAQHLFSKPSTGAAQQNDQMYVDANYYPEGYIDDSNDMSYHEVYDEDDSQDNNDSQDVDGARKRPNLKTCPMVQSKWYKQYTDIDMASALEAVRQGMSPLQAGRNFGIPSRTLYSKVKRLGITPNHPQMHGGILFPPSLNQGMLMADGREGRCPWNPRGPSYLPSPGNWMGRGPLIPNQRDQQNLE